MQRQFDTLIIALFVCVYMQGQVTIGSSEKPIDGALLQLSNMTDYNAGEANATKGLGLPRVQLMSPTELYPMFKDTDSEYNTDSKKKTQKEIHTGMLVYAPKLWSDNYCPGLYVWDGERWQPFNKKISQEQKTFTDGEGNTYTYAKFGNLYWTTQDIRSTTEYAKGDMSKLLANISIEDYVIKPNYTPKKLGVNLGKTDGAQFTFETSAELVGDNDYIMNGDVVHSTLKDFVAKFGIKYTYPQAYKACPEGWKFPDYDDYQDMYSYVKSVTGLGENEAGAALKNDMSIYSFFDTPNVGYDWSGVNTCDPQSVNVGFNALPAGGGAVERKDSMYGSSAFWWYNQGPPENVKAPLSRYNLRENTSLFSIKVSFPDTPISQVRMSYTYGVRCARADDPNP